MFIHHYDWHNLHELDVEWCRSWFETFVFDIIIVLVDPAFSDPFPPPLPLRLVAVFFTFPLPRPLPRPFPLLFISLSPFVFLEPEEPEWVTKEAKTFWAANLAATPLPNLGFSPFFSTSFFSSFPSFSFSSTFAFFFLQLILLLHLPLLLSMKLTVLGSTPSQHGHHQALLSSLEAQAQPSRHWDSNLLEKTHQPQSVVLLAGAD